jgi:hypothetical protein
VLKVINFKLNGNTILKSSKREKERTRKNFKGRDEKLSQLYYRDLHEGHIAGGEGGEWEVEMKSFMSSSRRRR